MGQSGSFALPHFGRAVLRRRPNFHPGTNESPTPDEYAGGLCERESVVEC